MAPAHPHATSVAVYSALFLILSRDAAREMDLIVLTNAGNEKTSGRQEFLARDAGDDHK